MARKTISGHIGPRGRQTLSVVRSKSTGRLRTVRKGAGYNTATESALVPEAFVWRSVTSYHTIAKGGLGEVVKEIEKMLNHIEGSGGSIARRALGPTFELSQSYTPIETGDLRKSGELRSVVRNGRQVAEISYARNGFPFYAAFVHEIAEYSHLKPTQYKFLENAIRRDKNNIAKRIGRITRKVINVD